jgi:ABC-type multidrug transport system permease subunit
MALTKPKFIESEEFRDLAIAVIVLAFGFSVMYPGEPTLGSWFSYFLLGLVLVSFSVLVHEIAHRYVAARLQAKVHSNVWPSGVAATFISSLVTGGWFVFAAPWAVSITPWYLIRPGQAYAKQHIGPHDTALIAVSGPIANFCLAILAKLFSSSLGLVAKELITINVALAAFNLFPFFTLFPIIFARMSPFIGERLRSMPYVEGEFVFFGSRLLWAFTFTFIVVGGLCLIFLSLAASIAIALALAITVWIAWHYFLEGAAPYEMLKKEKFF